MQDFILCLGSAEEEVHVYISHFESVRGPPMIEFSLRTASEIESANAVEGLKMHVPNNIVCYSR